MHIISNRNILKELKLFIKEAKRNGHTITTVLAQDFEIEEFAILARRRFTLLKHTSPCSFTYRGIEIKRDDRSPEVQHGSH